MRNPVVRGLIGLGVAAVAAVGGLICAYGAGVSDVGGVSTYQAGTRLENDRQVLSAANQCLRSGEKEGEFWVTGRNYTPEGSILKNFYGDSVAYSSTLEADWQQDGTRWQKVRFSVEWKDFSEEGEEDEHFQEDWGARYWQLGNVVVRELAGQSYTFRCIDQNYLNAGEAGQTAALFLCDSVIPADMGAEYVYEEQENGHYDYVYNPGPIADFGDTGSYKHSRIRQWLDSVADENWGLAQVDLGVGSSYTGQTEEGAFEQLEEGALHPQTLGYQSLTGKLFVLSVEEAVRYRQYLWRFGVLPNEDENPETQTGAFSKGYWLRTPYGKDSQGIPSVYVVDLVHGVIRPQQVSAGDSQTMSIGVRPAFALPQQG